MPDGPSADRCRDEPLPQGLRYRGAPAQADCEKRGKAPGPNWPSLRDLGGGRSCRRRSRARRHSAERRSRRSPRARGPRTRRRRGGALIPPSIQPFGHVPNEFAHGYCTSTLGVVRVSARDRFRGCLVGLAAGDALGTTLEFSPPGSFDPIDDMVGGGPFGLRAGQWTDDTSMALCLATSLLESGGFDPVDQMGRYLRWFREGYLSSTGRCFDIGGTTREALVRFERTGEPYSGPTDPMSAGNGSLMRLAPVPMFFAGDAREAIDRSADSSRTTHGAVEAVDACRYFAGLLVGALRGVDKQTLLSEHYSPVEGLWDEAPLAPKIAAIAEGSFKHKQPPEIRGTGYVVDSLEAVLWAFFHTEDFRKGALKVVNLGQDADTTGAIFGQIAGAHYGAESIPAEWRQRLTMGTEITAMADSLHERADRILGDFLR
ncbi:MAG: ADP-ribosylglycohydrolase family protein [Acidimicrobiaceae bacterium]|nr:ADP-ribosylglycohydrolase family protein [Acidimicrobiaceae bacterium]